MQFVSNLKIGTRLALAFGLLIVVSVVVLAVIKVAFLAIEKDLGDLMDDRMVKVTMTTDLKDNVNQIARSTRNLLLVDDAEQLRTERSAIDTMAARNGSVYAELEKTVSTPKGKELLAAATQARRAYNAELAGFFKLLDAGDKNGARQALLAKIRPVQLDYMKTLDAFSDFQIELMKKSAQTVRDDSNWAFTLVLLMTGAEIALALLVAFLVTRSITGPLAEAKGVTEAIAEGDLTRDVQARSTDEVGQMVQALDKMQQSLRALVGGVRTGVDSVSTASGQIAAGNQDLSSRTEEQASSLQQTAASMEQLTSTVKQSADNAKQANQLASAASEAATKGGAVVGQVVSTMEDITASSKKIADIISVIDGIAFQTNILALNAAVEAARAGEQGRGFAVVAGEVRNLAQRSAQAAREIKSLISDSVEKVEAGSKQVNDAGAAMGEIVSQVKRVTDLIGEITSAALEQSSGIGQVNEAITQMDQVTQQNAALVEESAAAAASLKEQAGKLAEAVSVFKLAQGEARSVIAGAQSSARATPMASKAKPQAKRSAPAAAPAKAAAPEAGKAKDEWEEF
jgi:methyl-accepting chemotaxis protein